MTINSHSRGSGGSDKGRKENAKENGIWRKLSDEEYESEKAEIEVRMEVMIMSCYRIRWNTKDVVFL